MHVVEMPSIDILVGADDMPVQYPDPVGRPQQRENCPLAAITEWPTYAERRVMPCASCTSKEMRRVLQRESAAAAVLLKCIHIVTADERCHGVHQRQVRAAAAGRSPQGAFVPSQLLMLC